MERAQIETTGGSAVATLSVVLGVRALLAAPGGLLVAQEAEAVTLRWGIAGGGLAAILLGLPALVLARRGRLRAARGARRGPPPRGPAPPPPAAPPPPGPLPAVALRRRRPGRGRRGGRDDIG